jgi:hypothetical protein
MSGIPKPITQINNSEMVRVVLSPPPGMAFKNEMGGDVTCMVPRDKLMDLYNTLQMQLGHQIQFLMKQQTRQIDLTIDDDGEIKPKEEG